MRLAALTPWLLLTHLHAGVAQAAAPVAEQPEVTPSLEYLLEYRHNLDGGIARGGAWLDQLTLALGDAERWHASVLATNSQTFSDRYAGDLQAVSNLDAGHTLRLYEAWYQWRWGQTRLLAGLYDLNSEFDAIETAGLFTQSSHGIGPDISQSGERGPSIFPHTSVALRLDGGDEAMAWRLALLDAVPGDPDDEARTAVHLSGDDGALLIAEIERPGRNRMALGVWAYSRRFERIDGSGEARQGGVYAFVDRHLGDAGGWQWRGFVRIGAGAEGALAVRRYLGLGLAAQRDDTLQWGVALANAWLGDDAKASIEAEGGQAASAEHALEVTARWRIASWLSVQPSLAWISNPGARKDWRNASVAALRWEFAW